MFEKLKSFLANDSLFYGVLLILVAVSSFGLGQQSALERNAENRLGKQSAGVVLAPASSVPAPTPTNPQAQSPSTETLAPTITSPQTSREVEVVASKSGSKYHLPTCAGAKQIKPENLITFPSRAAAEAAGYTPAANCPSLQ